MSLPKNIQTLGRFKATVDAEVSTLLTVQGITVPRNHGQLHTQYSFLRKNCYIDATLSYQVVQSSLHKLDGDKVLKTEGGLKEGPPLMLRVVIPTSAAAKH